MFIYFDLAALVIRAKAFASVSFSVAMGILNLRVSTPILFASVRAVNLLVTEYPPPFKRLSRNPSGDAKETNQSSGSVSDCRNSILFILVKPNMATDDALKRICPVFRQKDSVGSFVTSLLHAVV